MQVGGCRERNKASMEHTTGLPMCRADGAIGDKASARRRQRIQRHQKKKRLEDELRHADLGIEECCELEERVLRLRRRLSR